MVTQTRVHVSAIFAFLAIGCQDIIDTSSTDQEIKNGTNTTIQTFPWQASITSLSGAHKCGGTIINPRWILTAQHCVDAGGTSIGTANLAVVVGITSGTGATPSAGTNWGISAIKTVDAVARAPGNVNPGYGKNDLALLHLSEPLTFSSTVSMVPLVSPLEEAQGATSIGTTATITGWGQRGVSGGFPDTLQVGTVPIKALPAHLANDGDGRYDNMISAGGNDVDSCGGDSGGPLMVPVNGITYQAGLVSFGSDPCGTEGHYVRVSDHSDWIGQIVSGGFSIVKNLSDLSGGTTLMQRGSFYVPEGTVSLSILMRGPTSNANLYVRHLAQPTATLYTCRPSIAGSMESCVINYPAAGNWYLATTTPSGTYSGVSIVASTVSGMGGGGFRTAPADYDNDGKTDISIKLDSGIWRIDFAANGFGSWDMMSYAGYGSNSAIPVPGDYDGDGLTDLAIKEDNTWKINYAAVGGLGDGINQTVNNNFGPIGSSVAVPADYDGDAKTDISVKRGPIWNIDYAVDGFGAWNDNIVSNDTYTDIPVPANYDGDVTWYTAQGYPRGTVDRGLTNVNGVWRIDYRANGFHPVWDFSLGYSELGTSLPAPGNYDCAGGADIAAKVSSGTFYFDFANSSLPQNGFTGYNYWQHFYGNNNAIVLTGDYNGDGCDDISLLTPGNYWHIDITGAYGWDWIVPVNNH